MSWSIHAAGTRDNVAAQLESQAGSLTKYPCAEPEESIKQAIIAALRLAVAAQHKGCGLRIMASGSMNYEQPNRETIIVNSNSLTVTVEPLFVEKEQ